MSHLSGFPLRVQVRPFCESAIFAIACAEVKELGLEVLPAAIGEGLGGVSPDLRIVLIDARATGLLDSQPTARQECPAFIFIQSRVGVAGDADRPPDAARFSAPRPAITLAYDGPADLRWKVGQTIAGFLSARFREAQRRQATLLTGGPEGGHQALLRFATHRDARLRQMALRLALSLAERQPEAAESMARQLAASNRAAAFPVAALLVRGLARRDVRLASALLGEMCLLFPAFRQWALARLTS